MIEEYSTIMPLYINTQMVKEKKTTTTKQTTKKTPPQQKKPLKKPHPKTKPTCFPELIPAFFTSTLNRNMPNMRFLKDA